MVHARSQQDLTPRTSHWTVDHLAHLQASKCSTIAMIDSALPRPLFAGLDLWDMWPLQTRDGRIAAVDDGEIWFILSAPQLVDPDLRHAVARIRLVERRDGHWIDHGQVFPDDFTPGSREWAGSAVQAADGSRLTLYFTAAGSRGDARDNWQQRIFATTGHWKTEGGKRAIEWLPPEEILRADNVVYQQVTSTIGREGFIKGFRDPAWFADPADGSEYLLFTGSLVGAASDFDGAVGVAHRTEDGQWSLLPPLLSMDGINNEPERPHIVFHAGRYYLFFSTQQRMFAPGVSAGPNGLYGFVADAILGPWLPLNGSGLVAANPPEAPQQAYSWWVSDDLNVFGFADMIGPGSAQHVDDPDWRRSHFAGVPAPVFTLALKATSSSIVEPSQCSVSRTCAP